MLVMRYFSEITTSFKYFSAAFVLCLCLSPMVHAQSIQFDNLSLKDGLSQSVVRDIAQDEKGFMWLATESGLNKYDGNSFTVFSHDGDDSTSMASNWVTSLLTTPNKSVMWVGTTGGLSKMNLETETFTSYKHSEEGTGRSGLSNNWITDLYEGPDQKLWVGTQEGLNVLDPKTNQIIHVKPQSNDLDSRHLKITSLTGMGHEIWLGSTAGLLIYDIKSETFKKPESNVLHDDASTLFSDPDNDQIWVGSTGGTIMAVGKDHSVKQVFSSKDGILDAPVQALNKDDKGRLWVGTVKGLNIFDPVREITINTIQSSTYANQNSLPTPDIRDIFIDNSSVVWISNYEGGVSKTNTLNKQFKHYKMDPSTSEGLASNQVKTIVEDKNNNIWLGTSDNGIEMFDVSTNTFKHYPHNPSAKISPSSNFIKRMMIDSNQNLWVASQGFGIDRFDMGTWNKRSYTPDDGLGSKVIYAIKEGKGGKIWFGTYGGGLSKYDPDNGSMSTLSHDPSNSNSLSNNFVTAIYSQSEDSLWLGTKDGLNIYNPQTGDFTIYKPNSSDSTSLSSGLILGLHEGPQGDIWIATYGGGVDRFNLDTKEFKHYRKEDGLPHNNTYNFLEDSAGNLWVSTNAGISRINPFNDQITNYTTSNGLQSREFNNGAYLKTSDGIMYFGGINGFNKFDPSKITNVSNAPDVSITNFALFNNRVPTGKMESGRTILEKSISHTSELNLSYQDYVFSFEFAAISYAFPDKNKYKYKMEGFDKEWNDIGNRNYASYTNIPPGDYTLKVKAADYNGVWSKEPATLEIHIAPPFWQTTWFYIISLIAILAIIYGIYRYRVRAIQKRNQELTNKVDERTEELHEKNDDLESTLQELEDTKDELVRNARKAGMADIATGVLHNVGNILNSINTSSSIMEQTLRNSKVEGLQKANTMLRDNMSNIEQFITENPKGKKLLSYYLKIEDMLLEEKQTMLKHNFRLNEKIHLINDVISTQQSYAGTSKYSETVRLEKMLENALTLQAGSIEKHDIEIEKDIDYDNIVPVEGQRTQIVHILVNLIKNAKEAMFEDENELKDKIDISLKRENSDIFISVSDTGCGISNEDLDKIFTHGFTTKEDGHGFGLHSCSNYMNEMGGAISVDSEGVHKGSTFTLRFPVPVNSNGQGEEEEE